jgi:L-ribulose-5-phosphate 4-epimerase
MSAVHPIPTTEALSPAATAIAQDIFKAGKRLLDAGSLSPKGKGAFNAAVKLGSDSFVIGGLDAAIVVSYDGTLLEGEPDRSLQEVVSVYAAIFREKPAVNAAIHTHSPHLTAYAIAHKPFPIHYWSLAKRAGVHEIPLAEWAPRYAAEPVIDAIRANPKTPVVLLKNRGLFGWGEKGIDELSKLLNSLDEGAQITLWSQVLGGAQPLPTGALDTFLAAKKG